MQSRDTWPNDPTPYIPWRKVIIRCSAHWDWITITLTYGLLAALAVQNHQINILTWPTKDNWRNINIFRCLRSMELIMNNSPHRIRSFDFLLIKNLPAWFIFSGFQTPRVQNLQIPNSHISRVPSYWMLRFPGSQIPKDKFSHPNCSPLPTHPKMKYVWAVAAMNMHLNTLGFEILESSRKWNLTTCLGAACDLELNPCNNALVVHRMSQG